MFFNSTKTNTLMNASVQATAMLLGALGFEPAPRSTIPARLSHLSPSGGTSLRDSVKAGLSMILQLNSALEQLGSMEVWNFVHIVITDGEDLGSQTSVEALALLFLMINQAIPTSRSVSKVTSTVAENSPSCSRPRCAVCFQRVGRQSL